MRSVMEEGGQETASNTQHLRKTTQKLAAWYLIT